LDNSTVTGLTQTQHDIQRQVEQHYAEKVQSLLDGVLGTENSKVRVNAEIDFTQVEKTITDFDPERQVIRSEQNIQEVSESTDSLSYPTVSQAKNASNVIQNYEISKTVSHIVEGTGNIKRLTVSAIINGVTKVVDENGVKKIEYTPRKQEEIDQLTLAIKNAVGYDPTRNDQISVLNVPFDTSLLEQEIEEQQPVVWYKDKEIIKLIALIAAILITIMLMFALIQSKFVKDRLRMLLDCQILNY
jgi:flagellar M-ring protein FliF